MKFSAIATFFIFAFFALMTNALPSSSVIQENGPNGMVSHVSGPGAISNTNSESITRITTSDGHSILGDTAFVLDDQGQISKIAFAKYF